jgi:hypothetical protein
MDGVSTAIRFQGLDQDDPEAVVIQIEMTGLNFNFNAKLSYDYEVALN